MSTCGKILLIGFMFCLFSVGNLSATEEFAETTGRECAVCHLDPSGGGELSPAGTAYALFLGTGSATATDSAPVAASHW